MWLRGRARCCQRRGPGPITGIRSPWRMNRTAVRLRLESGRAPEGAGDQDFRPPPWKMKLSGDSHRPENERGGRNREGIKTSAFRAHDLEGAPPARERALKVRGGREAAGINTTAFRWPLSNR